MATKSTLLAQIAADLVRNDLTSQIASAVSDTIAIHEAERFWFNQSRSLTFSTVVGQVAYGSAALARIPYLIEIDALFVIDGNRSVPLKKRTVTDFEAAWGATTSAGRPYEYAYIDNEIRLGPTPSAVYGMRLCSHYKVEPFADLAAGSSNIWTTEAELLIREAAKARLYISPIRDAEGAQGCQLLAGQALDHLRAETSKRMGTGVIQGTDF